MMDLPKHKVQYATIGHRLSTQFLAASGTARQFGFASLHEAYETTSGSKIKLPQAFSIEPISTDKVDMINGSDILVGYSYGEDDKIGNVVCSFMYDAVNCQSEFVDDLLDESNSFYQHHQARVIFDNGICQDSGSEEQEDDLLARVAFENALEIMVLQAKLLSHYRNESMNITLGVHEKAIAQIPDIEKAMLASGFTRDDLRNKNDQTCLYHLTAKRPLNGQP